MTCVQQPENGGEALPHVDRCEERATRRGAVRYYRSTDCHIVLYCHSTVKFVLRGPFLAASGIWGTAVTVAA